MREPLRLEDNDVAGSVLDQVVDVRPEVPAVPLDPLPSPAHHEEVHVLLPQSVQDDLVRAVSDLHDGPGVHPHPLPDPGELLEAADAVVDVLELDRLWREVPRNLHDVQETQFPVPILRDDRAKLDEVRVVELPERKEDPVS